MDSRLVKEHENLEVDWSRDTAGCRAERVGYPETFWIPFDEPIVLRESLHCKREPSDSSHKQRFNGAQKFSLYGCCFLVPRLPGCYKTGTAFI